MTKRNIARLQGAAFGLAFWFLMSGSMGAFQL